MMRKKITILLLTISSLYHINLNGQNDISIKKSTIVCDKIEFINSSEFNDNKQPFKIIDTTYHIKKTNGVIIVQTKDSTYNFKDNTTNEGFFEYTLSGQDINKKWILLRGQDYNQDFYYLIYQNTNKIDTLIGYPRIFGNKYLCMEGSYTDGTAFIEIWMLTTGKLLLYKRFSLIPCKIYSIDYTYLKDDYLYIKYEHNKYLKVKI
jgi:hypothetical protein